MLLATAAKYASASLSLSASDKTKLEKKLYAKFMIARL